MSSSSKPLGHLVSLELCFLLQDVVEASVKRVVHLASQWEKHRAPLVDEHRRLKALCSNQDVSGCIFVTLLPSVFSETNAKFACFNTPQLESSRKLSEIKSLHDKIRSSTEDMKKKEEIHKQLVMDDMNRFIYMFVFFKS